MPLYEKGQSGNPGGRPKGPSLKAELIRQLAKKGPDGEKNVNAVAAALIRQARAGDVAAIREILDRVDGKVPQQQQFSGDVGSLVFTLRIDRGDGDSDSDESEPGAGANGYVSAPIALPAPGNGAVQ